jgi:hypothetical protein
MRTQRGWGVPPSVHLPAPRTASAPSLRSESPWDQSAVSPQWRRRGAQLANGINGLIWNFKPFNTVIIGKPAGGVVRDEEAMQSRAERVGHAASLASCHLVWIRQPTAVQRLPVRASRAKPFADELALPAWSPVGSSKSFSMCQIPQFAQRARRRRRVWECGMCNLRRPRRPSLAGPPNTGVIRCGTVQFTPYRYQLTHRRNCIVHIDCHVAPSAFSAAVLGSP